MLVFVAGSVFSPLLISALIAPRITLPRAISEWSLASAEIRPRSLPLSTPPERRWDQLINMINTYRYLDSRDRPAGAPPTTPSHALGTALGALLIQFSNRDGWFETEVTLPELKSWNMKQKNGESLKGRYSCILLTLLICCDVRGLKQQQQRQRISCSPFIIS